MQKRETNIRLANRDRLQQIAADEGRSLSGLINWIVQCWLIQRDKEESNAADGRRS